MAHRKLLIIDQNQASAIYLRDLLQYFGYAVKVTPSWEEGHGLLAQEAFDALLFDENAIHRGLGTPLNTLRALGYEQPVLIMTDMALREVWSGCLDHGQVELINKPVSPSTLKFMVETALKKSRGVRVVPVIRLNPLGDVAYQAG